MAFLIAAAGTGGHVYPALAVANALVAEGVGKSQILFVGGDRLESEVFPSHGFDFLELELRGLRRSLSPSNLSLPLVVLRARARIAETIADRGVGCVLAMGGYVTIPAAMAASKAGVCLFVAEQNAGAGLANRIASRWAQRVFVSFPETEGLESGEWVGNPVRADIARLDRASLAPAAREYYGLDGDRPVLGVFGGSLGAKVINESVAEVVIGWDGPPIDVVHLAGRSQVDPLLGIDPPAGVRWIRKGFEDRMDYFYAVSKVVVGRAGGAVAEITATATPSILVPGEFGSSGHQRENAAFLEGAGAAVVLPQTRIADLGDVIRGLLAEPDRLAAMERACREISRPDAAKAIASAMIEAIR